LAIACTSGSALAVTLGQVSVESGIGQPLRAAIEITQYKVEDLRKLKLQLAPVASFEQAQMAFHPALNGLQTHLEFRGDGKPFIALTGLTPVNDHFIDVIVEAQWPSGRLAMNYTLLVSPVGATPAPPRQAGEAVIAPVVSSAALTPSALAVVANPAAAHQVAPETVTVQAGETASKLVLRQLPAGVTLDQMLLAMVRANPEAFIEGNVNLLREGVTVQLPNAQEAAQISAEEARQTVVAQTVDFVAYARRLAQSASKTPDTASREMSGKLGTDAPTPAPQRAAQDTLTLSKREASNSNHDSGEARLAIEREIQDKTDQLAALQKNIDTLKSLSAATALTPPSPPTAAQTDMTDTAALAQQPPLAPSLPMAVAEAAPSSLLAQISRSGSIWAWVLALLGGMLAWVWLARRRPSANGDLFAQYPQDDAQRQPRASAPQNLADAPLGKEPMAEEPMTERAPWPSGLPPQFANLDLNLTPAPAPLAAPETAQPTGPKA
jgi:pilus assembly protein FimV